MPKVSLNTYLKEALRTVRAAGHQAKRSSQQAVTTGQVDNRDRDLRKKYRPTLKGQSGLCKLASFSTVHILPGGHREDRFFFKMFYIRS